MLHTEYSDMLSKLNYNHKLKIRVKKRKTKYVLMLEYNHNNEREYEYLKLSLSDDKVQNKQNIRLAQSLRDEKERDLFNDIAGIKVFQTKKKSDSNVLFKDYGYKLVDNKGKRTKGFYLSGINSYCSFAGQQMKLLSITKKSIQDWLSASQLSQVAKHNYLRAIKYVLKNAIKEDLIAKNPAEDISISFPESKREFLTIEEVGMIASVKFEKPAVQDAFLFSCFTGLRMGDIVSLKWTDIRDGHIYHRQNKTGHTERLKLNVNAMEILAKQPKPSPTVFMLPSKKWFFDAIRKLMLLSGINKRITFHCARHTFATLLLTNDVDLYTVSKLLGHRDIQTTQIYAKLIDKKKDEAIDKLPNIKL